MNPFLAQFIQRAPQALRAVQGFGAKAAPKALQGVVDTVTNPQTYRRLAASAENTLQQTLPKAFAGPNFGGIPARFTGLISDVAGMPAGLARDVQSGMVGRAIQEAAGMAPQLSRGAGQAATGALRAPAIGTALRTGQTVLTSPLQTAIQTGGQFARDPGLRREFLRQFGGTTEKAARALSGATNVGRVGGLMQSLSPGGVTGLRGSLALPGALGGAAWGLADPMPLIEAGNWVGDRLSEAGIGYNPSRDSRVTPIQNRPVVNPGQLASDYSGAADRANRFSQYAKIGEPSQDANLAAVPPTVEATSAVAGLNNSSVARERAYQAEVARVAQMTAQNPDLQRYEAARLKAAAPGATPGQVQSAEDIGMQIWAKANPKLAAKVQPGQSGYDAIQGALAGNMARGGQGYTLPQQLLPTPQSFPTQVPGFPTGQRFSSGFGQPNALDAAKFQELLKLIGK